MFDFEFNLEYVHFFEFEFWFSWVVGLLLLLFFASVIVAIWTFFDWFFLGPLFKRYCIKHGYMKIDKDGDVL